MTTRIVKNAVVSFGVEDSLPRPIQSRLTRVKLVEHILLIGGDL